MSVRTYDKLNTAAPAARFDYMHLNLIKHMEEKFPES